MYFTYYFKHQLRLLTAKVIANKQMKVKDARNLRHVVYMNMYI